MGHNKSFSVSCNFEFDDAYFRKLGKPLSNLPTPPPSSRDSSASPSPRLLSNDVDGLDLEFLAPAVYLTRVMPPGLSNDSPSIDLVKTILSNANLAMNILALAGCILEAIPMRFRKIWRMSYPRTRAAHKRHTLPSGPIQPPDNDPAFPEVVVLAALIIADKFVQDSEVSTKYYGKKWGEGLWTCEQINFTERHIMEVLDYRILPLYEDDNLGQARQEIDDVRCELLNETSEWAREYVLYKTQPTYAEQGVNIGLPTPVATPKSELLLFYGKFDNLDKDAVGESSDSLADLEDNFHLSAETVPQ